MSIALGLLTVLLVVALLLRRRNQKNRNRRYVPVADYDCTDSYPLALLRAWQDEKEMEQLKKGVKLNDAGN